MAKGSEEANFYRGLTVLTMIGGSVFAAGALCVAAGWAVGLASAATLCAAWGVLFWMVARNIERGTP